MLRVKPRKLACPITAKMREISQIFGKPSPNWFMTNFSSFLNINHCDPNCTHDPYKKNHPPKKRCSDAPGRVRLRRDTELSSCRAPGANDAAPKRDLETWESLISKHEISLKHIVIISYYEKQIATVVHPPKTDSLADIDK